MRELNDNNNRVWFEANKQRYLESVLGPSLALVVDLGRKLSEAFPPIAYDARPNGGSLLRIHRDTRFSADKRPYKTNIAMMFSPGGRKKMEAPGFGLQITVRHIDLMAGQFSFSPAQLAAYRAAVLNEDSGAALVRAVDQVTAAAGNPTLPPRTASSNRRTWQVPPR